MPTDPLFIWKFLITEPWALMLAVCVTALCAPKH